MNVKCIGQCCDIARIVQCFLSVDQCDLSFGAPYIKLEDTHIHASIAHLYILFSSFTTDIKNDGNNVSVSLLLTCAMSSQKNCCYKKKLEHVIWAVRG